MLVGFEFQPNAYIPAGVSLLPNIIGRQVHTQNIPNTQKTLNLNSEKTTKTTVDLKNIQFWINYHMYMTCYFILIISP